MGLPRRPAANIESKSSAKSLKRLDSSTWKLCLRRAESRRVAPRRARSATVIIRRIIVYFPANVADFHESIVSNLLVVGD